MTLVREVFPRVQTGERRILCSFFPHFASCCYYYVVHLRRKNRYKENLGPGYTFFKVTEDPCHFYSQLFAHKKPHSFPIFCFHDTLIYCILRKKRERSTEKVKIVENFIVHFCKTDTTLLYRVHRTRLTIVQVAQVQNMNISIVV